MKFAFMAAHRETFKVGRMCNLLGVSPSGFYAWQQRPRSARETADQRLSDQIRCIHAGSRQTYGVPRVQVELRETHGVRCSRKRVARLMRASGLRAKVFPRFRITTQSDHRQPIAANLLPAQQPVQRADQVWVADITYIATREGWLFLAAILDLYSRRVVGWSMNGAMTHQLVLNAFDMAVAQRQPARGLLHHSDRGTQYACRAYQTALAAHGVRSSMSGAGRCYDNAAMESFFHTLKTELVHHEQYARRQDARRSIFEYIEVFYNRYRRHSALGYATPEQFERQVTVA
jgi:transposase InsO family protein